MKNVYIKFNYQFDNEDYKEDAITYGAKYNILIIENVKEVILKDGVLYVTYKLAPRKKKSHTMTFTMKTIIEVTTN